MHVHVMDKLDIETMKNLFFFVNIYLTSSKTLIFKLKIKTPINIINEVNSQ